VTAEAGAARDGLLVTDLVARAKRGEKQAWDVLVERYALRDPGALPGWLATTTRRECSRVRRAAWNPQVADYVPDAEKIPDRLAVTAEQELLMAERHTALREAFADLPQGCRRLIALLIEDPPVPYAEISARLGMPVGSIGPTRSRCLDKLRRHPAIAALINAEVTGPQDEMQVRGGI
jgi:RNA polymerase sigma factor (sigma-70 family)